MRFPEVVWIRKLVFTDFDELGIAPSADVLGAGSGYTYYAARRVPERGEWFAGIDPFLGPIVASTAPMDPPPGREVSPGEVLEAWRGSRAPGDARGIPIPFAIEVVREPYRVRGRVVVGDVDMPFEVPSLPVPKLRLETEGGVVRGYREIRGARIPLGVDELSDLVRHYTAVAIMVSGREKGALREAIRVFGARP